MSICKFQITSTGLELEPSFESAEAVLTGLPTIAGVSDIDLPNRPDVKPAAQMTTVLVVDDEASIRDLVAVMLSDEG